MGDFPEPVKTDVPYARRKRQNSHKGNPLSNPEDRAHYLSRVRTEAAKKGGAATWAKRDVPMSTRPLNPAPSKQPGKISLKSQILFGPLRQWMKGYALWIVSQSPLPNVKVRAARIGVMSKHKAGVSHVKALEARADFQAFVDELQGSQVNQARAAYEEMFPLMTEAQKVALQAAIDDPKMFKSVARVVEGMTERVWPRKQPESDTKKVVHIHLSGQQAQALAAEQAVEEIPEAEITLIEGPKEESA